MVQIFPSAAMLWIKEVEMVDSLDELKSSRSEIGEDFPPRLWTRSSRIPNSKRRLASRSRKPKKRPVPERKTHRLHDLCLLLSDGEMERILYYRCQKNHTMKSWKVSTNWEHVSLINSKPFQNCTTWRFIRRYRCPIIKKMKKNGEEEKRSKTSITKFRSQALENWNRSRCKESKGLIGVEGGEGICYQSKAKGQCS